jgi:menaquinone-dependent protoporphyrinogen oxidase
MTRRILVTYGTKHGSTREVAETVAEALNGLGVDVTTRPAGEIDDLAPYAGVVIGGALYTGRWHRDSVRFLKTHRSSLESMTVAVFAIGPQTAEKHDLEASRAQLDKALERFPGIRPRAVAVFGGVIDPDALRFPFSRMPASDARDWEAIRAWAEEIAAAFGYGKAASNARDHRNELQQTPR